MSAESVFWKVLTLMVGLLTAAIPAYVAYDLYSRGPAIEKRVQLQRLPPINALWNISTEGTNVKLTVNNQPLDNLFTVQAIITNIGSIPILPIDYYKKLSVSIQKPWKILNVDNSYPNALVKLHWKRVDNTKFEAEPALLNPGDYVIPKIYITNTELGTISALDKIEEPQITWSARIVNLRDFSEPPSSQMNQFGIRVDLSGWALPFTIGAALLFQALYLHLLFCAGFLRVWNWRTIALILCASLLGFAAAESIATYLIGNPMTKMFGVQHWINAPWIIIHIVVLCFLFWKGRKAPACRSN
ncbi:MAG: hypothetical protein ACHQ2F_01520 [Desulfobaccales bacterium]